MLRILAFVVLVLLVAAVNSKEVENPLEFITPDNVSDQGLTYGFKLLEDIRQVRMLCQERKDELEQELMADLQRWTEYSLQARQMVQISNYNDEKEMEQVIHSTYVDIESRRNEQLEVIERQCDESLEELLMQRKFSMLKLSIDFMTHNIQKLVSLMRELIQYKTHLQKGLAECVIKRRKHYEHGISSKLLAPEEFCFAPDINILITFLDHMDEIIGREQQQFFGDDEDLGNDIPCAASGCQERETETMSTSDATYVTEATTQKFPVISLSTNTPINENSLQTTTKSDNTEGTNEAADIHHPTEGENPPTLTTENTSDNRDEQNSNTIPTPSVSTELSMTTPHDKNNLSTSVVYTVEDITEKSKGKNDTKQEDTTTSSSIRESTSTTEALSPTTEATTASELTKEPVPQDIKLGHSKNRSSTGNRKRKGKGRPFIDDENTAKPKGVADDSQTEHSPSANAINPALTYSFIIVCTALVMSILTVVVATIIVHKRRRQLASKVYVTHKQIATMKETGYINPSYNLLDGENE